MAAGAQCGREPGLQHHISLTSPSHLAYISQVRSADASLGYSTAVHADLAAGVTGQSVGTTCS